MKKDYLKVTVWLIYLYMTCLYIVVSPLFVYFVVLLVCCVIKAYTKSPSVLYIQDCNTSRHDLTDNSLPLDYKIKYHRNDIRKSVTKPMLFFYIPICCMCIVILKIDFNWSSQSMACKFSSSLLYI